MQQNTMPDLNVGGFHADAELSQTLPSSWYMDAGILALEKENIFFKNWWYAGAESAVLEVGDYATVSVVDQDVFLIRGQDGVLRGFYNVCRHRAHRLLDGRGCVKNIVCPYHGWTYATDGQFRGARGVDGLANFDPASSGLVTVRVSVMIGLVFVNLDPGAKPLEEIAAPMLRDMRTHCPGLDRLSFVRNYDLETAANWKTLVDNDLESYHSAVAHPSLMGLLDYSSFRIWEYDFTTCHAMTNTNSDNDAYGVSEGDPVQRAIYTWLWPNTAFFIAPGRNNLGVFQMIPTGPETSVQHWDFYFEDPELKPSEQAYLDWTIDTLIPEDTVLYENVQRGLRSKGYTQGRLVVNRDKPEWSEHHVHMFQKMVRDAVVGTIAES